jgi:hypothetical protein
MLHDQRQGPSFSQSGASFDDIVLRGARGGASAVESYLKTRRLMLVREVSQITAQSENPCHYVRAIAVIEDARKLLIELLNVTFSQSHNAANREENPR